MFFSCAEDDDFSSASGLSLTFSSDTISFDTVFTTIGSATKRFKIYNRNDNSLVIQSIELMNPAKSGFRMNIDGEKGTKLTNVEILKKDSIYGFVEVTVDPQNTGNPILIRDSIRFVTNGDIQYLYLDVIGQDVFIWKKKQITADTIITNLKPILVYDSITIKKDVKLTIGEGVTFFMKRGAVVDVHGVIEANGSVENPIVFRGERFDKIEGDIPYDNVPGQWGGIYFSSESYENQLTNVHVRNAVRGITFYTSLTQKKKAVLKNVIVHNTSEYGVRCTNSNIDAENCLFTNSRTAALILNGGQYSFLHCTIANYYSWSSRRTEALILSNYSDIGKETPLIKCDFINSIIYGSFPEELLLDNTGSTSFNYQFTNCLIRNKENNVAFFENIIWNKDPLFKDLNTNRIYSYNFELENSSPAIDSADKSYSLSVPYDLKGHYRLEDSNPDIGCYEWSE